MKPVISHQQEDDEFWTEEKCHIIELSNSQSDENVSIARARVEPGITTSWHKLTGIVERYVILEGEGVVEVGDLPTEKVTEGSVVIIPPGCPQRITNTGEFDLIFLAICSPRFRDEAYIDLENQGH